MKSINITVKEYAVHMVRSDSYENTNKKWLFYFGYTGLETLHNHETFYPRLEAAIRKIK